MDTKKYLAIIGIVILTLIIIIALVAGHKSDQPNWQGSDGTAGIGKNVPVNSSEK